ncbi:transposase [Paraburkholderia sp. CNPSo 3155]|nr:transposase [Paraburkholderia atlantica]
MQAEHEPPPQAAQDLAVSAAGNEDQPRQSGVGTRHQLHPDGAGLRVSDGCGGLGQPKVLAHRVAITLEAIHAVEALEEAFAKYGQPEIVNTDQGSQFTATAFTDAVLGRGIKLSMDGKGAWRDNVFVERVWRSVKYEEVYLKAYESVNHARRSIGDYINLYNQRRPHSSLEDCTPDEAYFATLPAIKSAA